MAVDMNKLARAICGVTQTVKPTHCAYLLDLITKQCQREGFHYTVDGCVTTLRDSDGQRYRATITPVQEADHE